MVLAALYTDAQSASINSHSLSLALILKSKGWRVEKLKIAFRSACLSKLHLNGAKK